MGEEKQFGFGVEGGALDAGGVPGGADLDAAMDEVDVHVGGHTDDVAGGVENGEREHGAGSMEGEAAKDVVAHGVWRGNCGVPKLVEVAVADGGDEAGKVIEGDRDEFDVLTGERHGLKERIGHQLSMTARGGVTVCI